MGVSDNGNKVVICHWVNLKNGIQTKDSSCHVKLLVLHDGIAKSSQTKFINVYFVLANSFLKHDIILSRKLECSSCEK